jgi:hypothetical protein
MREFLSMAVAGLVVANVSYALGLLPPLAVVAGVGAALVVAAVLGRRARTGEGD